MVPPDGHPGRVADEPVHQVDVEVGTEAALGDALLEHVHPHGSLFAVALVDEAELRESRQPLGLVLIDDDLGVPVLDGLERRHEEPPLDALQRIGLALDDLLVAAEEPVEEIPEDLLDHLLLGLEVVVEAAGEDSGGIRDVAHGGGPQSTVGEHGRGELQKLVAARRNRPVHPFRVSTKRLLG